MSAEERTEQEKEQAAHVERVRRVALVGMVCAAYGAGYLASTLLYAGTGEAHVVPGMVLGMMLLGFLMWRSR